MTYTDEEIGLISGVLQSYFTPRSVSQQLRERYWTTYQHIEGNRIEVSDLVNIKAALQFLCPEFHGNRQTQRDIITVLAKTELLLKDSK